MRGAVQPTYFSAFLMGEQAETPPPTVAEVLEHVANWLFKNARRPLARPVNWPKLAEPLVFPGGEKIQVLRWQDEIEERDVAAVRFEHGDLQSRLLWRTDCIIVRSEKPQPTMRFFFGRTCFFRRSVPRLPIKTASPLTCRGLKRQTRRLTAHATISRAA
ncbi:protein of unknown function [Bradyrhizobium vignae]|uniref:Uncharacterized protein n=1 Tax=Bradyrhizobium vignae TaxID=1549949 RepID=A0A2U3PU16_9BRAD|nr:protein of unknown function [Bradyrhizobium vignae]